MQAEIITIGDELLIGQVVDTNSAWMAVKLNEAGIQVKQITSVSDNRDHIIQALNEAQTRADLILITGGIGPTPDDITKKTLAGYFNTRLVFSEKVYQDILELLGKRSIPVNEQNRKQAEVPENALILPNKYGTAPGMWFDLNDKIFVSMPGVPHEMKALMENEVIPRVLKLNDTMVILHRTILTYGTFEARLAEILAGFEKNLPAEVNLAYLPSNGVIRLRLTIAGTDRKSLENILDQETGKLYRIIPHYIFGRDDDTLEKVVGKLLTEYQKTLSVAESCTGGNISKKITSVPGSSGYYIGSVIAYSNRIKEDVLGVNRDTILKYGAVSREVVEKMAKGVRQLYRTDFSLATSGIAGPEGGTVEKPVGTTWIAVSGSETVISKKFNFGSERQRNIERASLAGLNMLRMVLMKNSRV